MIDLLKGECSDFKYRHEGLKILSKLIDDAKLSRTDMLLVLVAMGLTIPSQEDCALLDEYFETEDK
jgi:hypothetical protein